MGRVEKARLRSFVIDRLCVLKAHNRKKTAAVKVREREGFEFNSRFEEKRGIIATSPKKTGVRKRKGKKRKSTLWTLSDRARRPRRKFLKYPLPSFPSFPRSSKEERKLVFCLPLLSFPRKEGSLIFGQKRKKEEERKKNFSFPDRHVRPHPQEVLPKQGGDQRQDVFLQQRLGWGQVLLLRHVPRV